MKISKRIILLTIGILLVTMWGQILPEGLQMIASFQGFAWYKYLVAYAFLLGPLIAGIILIAKVIYEMAKHRRNMFTESFEEQSEKEIREIRRIYEKGRKYDKADK